VARFLVVVPPLTGHVNPTVALGDELRRRGHAVAWVTYGEVVGSLLPPDAEIFRIGDGAHEALAEHIRSRSERLRGAAALEFLWRDFLLPLALGMVPGVEDAVDRFAPDVLVVDQQTFAGALVAQRRELVWATSATTSAELVDPFQGLPKVGRWVRDGLAQLQRDHGIDPAHAGDLRFSEHLVLAFTTEALTGPVQLPPGAGPLSLVGPSLAPPTDADPRWRVGDFPIDWLLGEGPRILVSLGTVSMGAGDRFFGAVVEAVAATPTRAVLVATPAGLGPLPANVLARPRVPQLAVLEHVDAVVSHAGHNTVCEALANGLPLVLAPIRDDQPVVAEQVVRAGAGIRVRFGRAGAAELGAAIAAVLEDPGYRRAAGVIARSFAEAGGAAAAADALEGLVR
jgi:UDP:flavonoid glycosyltransferase YjiC (YdhE family)